VHTALEHHFRELLAGNPPPSVDELLDQYRVGWNERDDQYIRFGKDEDAVKLAEVARRMLAAFHDHALARPDGQILAVEETLQGELLPGLPPLLGRVDLIVETPNELVISDWKSSRSRWSLEQVDDAAEQLLLYGALARDFAPGKRIRIEFSVLTKTKEVAIDRHSQLFDQKRLDRTKRVIEHVYRAIEHEVFYPAPSPMNCGSCPFREPCRKWPG
jgi:CRISPR/Cas system-associated exonuclease Cas4 (RecB family)